MPASRGVPTVDHAFFEGFLRRARVDITEHNLFAVQERLGIMFCMKARQFIDGMGTRRDMARFMEKCGYPDRDMATWPQRVLNGMAEWNRQCVPHIQDFPQKYSDMLLEGRGSGTGMFGDPSSPLPTATEWNMGGIGQGHLTPMRPPA